MQQKFIHGPVYGRNDNLMSFVANLDVHDTKARQTSTRLLYYPQMFSLMSKQRSCVNSLQADSYYVGMIIRHNVTS
jgi:hypothetical protein